MPWHAYGDRELIGHIDLDPAVRVPTHLGDHSLEILIECKDLPSDEPLGPYLDECRALIQDMLMRLPRIKGRTIEMASPEWVAHYGAQPAQR